MFATDPPSDLPRASMAGQSFFLSHLMPMYWYARVEAQLATEPAADREMAELERRTPDCQAVMKYNEI